MGVLALVVRVQRRRSAHDLLIERMAPGVADPADDRLARLVRHDDTLTRLLLTGVLLAQRRQRLGRGGAAGACLLALVYPPLAPDLRLPPTLGIPLRLPLLRRARRPG